LNKKNCFDSDPDQEAIFKALKEDNLVVQGPPGTGKSQLLANLLAKLLHEGSSHLLVSEKRTALCVLEQKLKTRQLHHFVF
jgi:DNA replication protein DnaC